MADDRVAPDTALSVGLVGVGEMGWEIAQRLAPTVEVHASARRPEVARRLDRIGIPVEHSPVAAASGRRAVVICVRTDEQVREVCLGPDGLMTHLDPGSILVVHTTGSPRTAQTLASARDDVDVLDAPFSGSPAQVRAGAIPLLVGGTASAVARATPLLGCYGDPITHVGPVGSGQRIKLINNLMLAANAEVAAAALRIAEEAGFPSEEFADVIARCSGRSFALELVARSPDSIAHLAGFLVKDIDVALAAADDEGIDLATLGSIAGIARTRFSSAESPPNQPDRNNQDQ